MDIKDRQSCRTKVQREIQLVDIFDVNELQTLQNAFSKSNNIASTIVDLEGEPITEPSGHCSVCTLIRQTKKGLRNCILSGKKLGKHAMAEQRPYFHNCRSIGFVDACAPIVVDGKHIANWLIGQNWVGNVVRHRVEEYADEIGANKEAMLQAYERMDKISEVEFKNKLEFLWIMANQISNIAYQNLKAARQVEDASLANQKLINDKVILEQTLSTKNSELKALKGLLPICSSCKKIRDEKGYWQFVETYIQKHSEALFTHSVCPDCAEEIYGKEDWFIKMRDKKRN